MLSHLEARSAASSVIESVDKNLMSRMTSFFQESKENIDLALGNAFSDHLASTCRRISQIRTILTKDKQESLLSVYVNLTLESDEDRIQDRELLNDFDTGSRILVQGTGGAGKSMLLKYLVTHSILTPNGRIPVFVELRSLDFQQDLTLEDMLFENIKSKGASESKRIFFKALSEGLVVVFLDGLDEVPYAARTLALEKINSFAARHSRLCVIVSSRPGQSREGLGGFDVFNVMPLTREQAIEVVRKTSADSELQDAFIEKLQGPLFDQHRTFLGIPLLVVMMLLTFSSYSDIPDRMSVFYEQAFSTLYAIHDTVSKGPYKRQHFASLAPDEFSRTFETFCYISLSKERYAFTYSSIIETLSDALKIAQINAEPELFLKDLEESVCLIIRDGVNYVFAHRSFQEYFSAKFALRHNSENQFVLIDNCIGREWQHNTVKLMDEIDPVKFREAWIVPALAELYEMLSSKDGAAIDEKLGILFNGWHISLPIGVKDPTLDQSAVGYFLTDHTTENRPVRLSISLSRVLDLDNAYDAFPAHVLLPSNERERREFVEKLGKKGGDARELSNWLQSDFGNIDTENPSFVVMIKEKNRQWFEAAGLEDFWDEYSSEVAAVLGQEREKVAEQKMLEDALLG